MKCSLLAGDKMKVDVRLSHEVFVYPFKGVTITTCILLLHSTHNYCVELGHMAVYQTFQGSGGFPKGSDTIFALNS